MSDLDDSELTRLVIQHLKSAMRTGRAQQGKLTTGSTQQVSCQASFGEASQFTVQFDIEVGAAGKSAPADGVFAIGAVEWTVDGNTILRTCDVAAGASISGCGESVKAVLIDKTPSNFAQGVQYGAEIAITLRPRANTAVPPIRTGRKSSTVVPAGSVGANVPPGANGVIVYGRASAGGTPTLGLQVFATGGVDPAHLIASTEVTPGQTTALPSGAGQVFAINDGAANADITIVFTIDG